MKRLPEPVKRRIVEHLACFRSPSEVVGLIAEEFDITLTPRHVRTYDPSSFQCAASPKLRDYHARARRRFQDEIAAIPITHRAVRLRRLDELYHEAIAAGERREAAGYLEQAAKEVGGAYTNSRQVAGVVGHVHVQRERTPEEARNMLVAKITEALARLPKPAKASMEAA